MEQKRKAINIYCGVEMDPYAALPEQIKPEDIAHALSLVCRAGGHLRRFYSVAQHSINCWKEAEAQEYSKRICLLCLVHDASEAYIADITRPVKARLTEYLELEEQLQTVILKACGLWPLGEEERLCCKQIDDAMLCAEFEALHPSGRLFESSFTMKNQPEFSECSPKEVEKEWLDAYDILTK